MNMPNLSPEEGSGECWEQTIYALFAEKQRRSGLLRTVKAFLSVSQPLSGCIPHFLVRLKGQAARLFTHQ